ncbi:hypothetical protein D9619_000566 [Psilocybe cf. subviscida]|uniref:Cyclin N-terminal domain-containing protein n=1 Tax=Psilocybe cf. subviscida TaxID=2480587 RepID=A0A8H5F319_9AGAR|nr:hypothetical protein D9619_000566 [Psilocybe cf. subviscida]
MTVNSSRSKTTQEFSHKSTNGSVDLRLFSEICSQFITNRFQDARYKHVQGEPWKQTFPAYIAGVIRKSDYGISMAIVALALVARYQDALLLRSCCCAHTVDEACRLFLIAYIIAGKVLYDEHISRRFWRRVSDEQYSCASLGRLEMQFYDMVDWRVRIDLVAYAMTFGEVMQSYRNIASLQHLPKENSPAYQRIKTALRSTRPSRNITNPISRSGGRGAIDEEMAYQVLRSFQGGTSVQLTTFNVKTRKHRSAIA